MTVTWKIINTKSRISNGLITQIDYLCEAQSEDQFERKVSKIKITGDPTDTNFIPYNQLTEEVVVQWVKDSLGQQQVQDIENELQDAVTARIAAKALVTITNGLPWK